MYFTKTVSTVLLISSITTIFLFAFIFWFYTNADNQTLTLLKDALSTTSGFFGGITTLVAAYIASRLFNDWKVQHNKIVEKEIAWDVVQKFDIADLHLSLFKENYYLYKLKCDPMYEISDFEFQNLNDELQKILAGLKGLTLEFSSYLESLRKYSVVAENTYHDDIKQCITDINFKLVSLIQLKGKFPSSIDYIDKTIEEIIPLIIDIESNNINIILKELKAP